MVTIQERHLFPFIEVNVDRGELERVIREAYTKAFGEEDIVDVYVSRFPDEYGAMVFLKHVPPPEAEDLAVAQEDYFRSLGIRLGILVLKAKTSA